MKYVYLVKCGDNYKIGVATNLLSRIRGLQTSNANQIELVTAKRTPKYSEYERRIHKQLTEWKTNGGKEWFNLSCERAIAIAILVNQAPQYDENEIDMLKNLITESLEKQAKVSGFMKNVLQQFNTEKELIKDVTEENIKGVKAEVDLQMKLKDRMFSEQELAKSAMSVFIKANRASASLLQSKLRIGYARAARILELLEDAGMVSPADGANPRKVLKKTLDFI